MLDYVKGGTIKVHFQCDPRLEMDADWLPHKKIAREKYLGFGVYERDTLRSHMSMSAVL